MTDIPQTPRTGPARIQCSLVMLVNERRVDGKLVFDLMRENDDSIVVTGVPGISPDGSHPPPPGSMWWDPFPEWPVPGGRSFTKGSCLMLMTPGGPFNLDGRAPDCSLPNDMVHRCYRRKGRPPNITLGKGRPTCGANEIISVGDYRGFLWDGELIEAREIVSEPGTG